MKFTVAIDGPAAAGKGTVSQALARHFGLAYLDTGLLYRAVGKKVLAGADPLEAARALQYEDLRAEGLRSPEVAQAASKVAANAAVRSALVDFQRSFARREGGAVLDGRDIGTVICPDADAKLFVTASDAVRAQRRYDELRARGLEVTLDQVRKDMEERDKRDAQRDAAPMVRAADAVLLDTSDITAPEALDAAIRVVAPLFEQARARSS